MSLGKRYKEIQNRPILFEILTSKGEGQSPPVKNSMSLKLRNLGKGCSPVSPILTAPKPPKIRYNVILGIRYFVNSQNLGPPALYQRTFVGLRDVEFGFLVVDLKEKMFF